MADALDDSADGDDVHNSVDDNIQSPSDKGCSTYSNSSRTTSSEDIPTWCSRMVSYRLPSHIPKAKSRYQR